jgi:hypothetical protein
MIQTIDKAQESSKAVSLDGEMLNVFVSLSDALKIEVLHYAEYLLNKEINTSSSSSVSAENNDNPKRKYRQAGTMAGMITMADDFDEPLEELQEYMQ